jgi:hypothetical protein
VGTIFRLFEYGFGSGRCPRLLPILSMPVLAMSVSTGCSANIGAVKGETAFYCQVSGAEQLTPAMTEAAICDLVQTSLAGVIANPMTPVKSLPAATSGDWVKVDIRLSKKRSASALVSQRVGAHEETYPEIAVDVMDKALSKRELEILAGEVAKLISLKAEK